MPPCVAGLFKLDKDVTVVSVWVLIRWEPPCVAGLINVLIEKLFLVLFNARRNFKKKETKQGQLISEGNYYVQTTKAREWHGLANFTEGY